MSVQNNLGNATPQVRILSSLPNVKKDVEVFNFDVSAFSWQAFQTSPFFPPLLMEYIETPEHTIGAIYPSKRKFFINNYLEGTDVTDSSGSTNAGPYITWRPISIDLTSGVSNSSGGGSGGTISDDGIISSIIKPEEGDPLSSYWSDITDVTNPRYTEPEFVQSGEYPLTYKGPRWKNSTLKEQPAPDDDAIIKKFVSALGSGAFNDDNEENDELEITYKIAGTIKTVAQTVIEDKLWWGIESSPFLKKNMPFWITISKPKRSPSPRTVPTEFIISLGIDTEENSDRYDIIISMNEKPKLLDYYGTSSTTGNGQPSVYTFDEESARINDSTEEIHLGFMTFGGRLVIYVNDAPLVYTRTKKDGEGEDSGTLKTANIGAGSIRVYGTNVACNMCAYPMTFADFSALAIPVPFIKEVDVVGQTNPQQTLINYSAVNTKNEPTGLPVVNLPLPPEEIGKKYGIDCRKFSDQNGVTVLQGEPFGFKKEGYASLFRASGISQNLASGLPNTNFFVMTLQPEDRVWDGDIIIPNAKAPYFFKLKGVDIGERSTPLRTYIDATPDVISIQENSSAPDYFHVKSKATVTLYNENGQYNYLRNVQRGIDISWGWNGNRTKTFTGIIMNTNTSEVPGKETITLQCEDYMHILDRTPIVNSPFYDGMIAFFAIRDLAKRASLSGFSKDWDNEEEYFLPAGYSFSQPKMRFKSTDRILQCMLGIVKRFEAYIYFDGEGILHIDKLEGGIFSLPPPVINNQFVTNIDDVGSSGGINKMLIIEEKGVTFDFSSTVNHISILTLDRDNRQPIIYSRAAQASQNRIPFKKKMMLDQPAYGELAAAKKHALLIAQRVFSPIRKTTFKTVDASSSILPLTFVTVDNLVFRLMSVSRNYSADSQDFNQSFEAEWLGG